MTNDASAPAPEVDDGPTRTDRARAIGAGLAMLVVVLSYGASRFGDPDRWWAAGLAIVVGILLADGLADIRTMLPTPGVAPLTIVAALVAIFLCVPETDQLPIVALLPGALVALEIVQRRQLPIEWYVVAAAAVGWGGLFGATGRQSALAGALFAWWVVLLPGFINTWRRVETPWRAWAVAAVAAASVMVMARTGGIASTWPAIVLGIAAPAVISVLVAVALVGRTPEPRSAGRPLPPPTPRSTPTG